MRGGPGHRQQQLTQTLIVRLLKTHFLHQSLIFKSQQNRIELVTRPGATSSATFPRYYDTLHTSSPARATLYEGLEADHSTTDWQRVTRANSVENARVPGGTFSHSRVAGQLSPRVPGSQHQQVSLAGPRTFGGTANTVVNDQIMDTSSRFLVQPVVNVFVR